MHVQLEKETKRSNITVGPVNDAYEREADHAADQIIRGNTPALSSLKMQGKIQRKCAACASGGGLCPKCEEEKIRLKARDPTSSTNMRTQTPSADLGLNGGGSPLTSPVREFFESRFQEDFSGVRIHTDSNAKQSAESLNARAYTYGNHIVFGEGEYSPQSLSGRHLLAHELTHTLQQQKSSSRVQRLLRVNRSAPAFAPANDPANTLSAAQRVAQMNTLIQALCPDFSVDSATGIVGQTSAATRPQLASSAKKTGCCCLSILVSSPQTKTIQVSQVVGPHNRGNDIVLSPTDSPVEFGSFSAGNTLVFQTPAQGRVTAAGHELCGHAALMVTGGHPGNDDRLTTDVHDPTVNIENAIATEQGVATRRHRGLARSGSHRGESVDRITIARFPRNTYDVASLPAAEQAKIEFAANYINENETWVTVEGHSDAAGTAASKQAASQQRADNVKTDLIGRGVSPTISKFGISGARFTRAQGMSDRNPPDPPLSADPANWRRVEILMAGFPAGAHNPPSTTPTGVTPHTPASGLSALRGSSDPCISLLVGSAYPARRASP